jgi:hypothetical protein
VDSDEEDDDDSIEDEGDQSLEEEEDEAEIHIKNKQWLDAFITDNLKGMVAKLESDLDNAKSKKIKSTAKKQKEKVGMINYKLT